ncbi:hypothetical protein ABIE51_001468 [Lysobacter sp. OAE881]|uniref:hypothetical protein n=1 Tax=Lysobacter sp. OAE881 TaxID=2663813 RepID=UPI00178ACAA3
MSWVAVAVGGASLVGGYMSSKGAKDAAKASAQGADRSADVQLEMFNNARADNELFRQAGISGTNEYLQMLGLAPINPQIAPSGMPADEAYLRANPDVAASGMGAWDHYNRYGRKEGRQWGTPTQAATTGTGYSAQQISDKLRATPGYQFAFGEGQRALESSAAASGGLFSGKTGKALTQYGQNFADQQYGTHLNRLAALAGIGQTAQGQNNQMSMQTAGNVGQAYQNAGNARASGIQGSANAWGNTLNGLAGAAGYAYGNRGSWGWGGI